MKLRTTIISIAFALILVGCSGEDGQSAEPCTTTTEEDGSVIIDCGAGGTTTIAPPESDDPLLITTSDAAAEDCPQGGTTITIGKDASGDGELSSEEIIDVVTTCHGETGETGATGDDGQDGSNTLMQVHEEPAGENCPAGGLRFDYGLDTNQNGELDEDEIQDTEYVCNGEQGAPGYVALVEVTEEPEGQNCTAGGLRIDTGLDLTGDGELAEEEIDSTSYICNGEPGDDGLTALVVVSPEPTGDNCALGGQRIDVGLDQNRNGELDEDEIDSTTYICNASIPFIGEGILQDIPLSSVESSDWSVCYIDTYDTNLPDQTTVLENCTGDFLMMACRQTGSDNLTLAAADHYEVVTQEVPAEQTAHHVSGSVGWYYSPDFSWGFFEAGTDLDRNQCDFSPTDALDKRLCWHTLDNDFGGYRCGEAIGLNDNTAWERLVLTY